jgi:predicted nucleic acid-binding protein
VTTPSDETPEQVTTFVDTNVLVYLRDGRDPAKQRAAAEWMAHLWETRSGRISAQVIQEYYVTVTAKLTPGMPPGEARDDIRALQMWAPPSPSSDVIEAAWIEQDRWGFSFWDSMIVGAARAQRCRILLTEDLTHGQDLDGIRVVSPFAETTSGETR